MKTLQESLFDKDMKKQIDQKVDLSQTFYANYDLSLPRDYVGTKFGGMNSRKKIEQPFIFDEQKIKNWLNKNVINKYNDEYREVCDFLNSGQWRNSLWDKSNYFNLLIAIWFAPKIVNSAKIKDTYMAIDCIKLHNFLSQFLDNKYPVHLSDKDIKFTVTPVLSQGWCVGNSKYDLTIECDDPIFMFYFPLRPKLFNK